MTAWQENGKIKLMIIVGTLPEIIRLAAVIKKARKYFDTILVHTGQNYDYTINDVFFKDLGLTDPELYLDAVGADIGETMGNIIAASYKAMVELKPDAVLVLGDTNSCLSVIGAKRLHIPIFHMEAGNRCKDKCLPEEANRRIVELLHEFHDQPRNLVMPSIPNGSFEKKLYSMYLSYLPKEKVAFDLKMNCDERGSFTELLKTADHGQFSVNISKPGVTKGQHWHNSKWEFFIVVSGRGLIQERKIGSDEILEFEVSGDRIQAVHMLPSYTHNIINLSETENLVTLMWANEQFDPQHPDTFFEPVRP